MAFDPPAEGQNTVSFLHYSHKISNLKIFHMYIVVQFIGQ